MRRLLVAWMVIACWASCVVCAACGRAPRSPEAPSPSGLSGMAGASNPGTAPAAALSGPVAFVPTTDAVMRYNDPQRSVPHSALGEAVTAAIRDAAARAGLPVPVPDARLFRACGDIAEVAPEDRQARIALDNRVIQFALHRNGIIEPAVRLLYGWGDVGAPAQFVAELRARLAAVLRDEAVVRFGVGVARRKSDGFGAIVFALQGSSISTLPIPRVAARDEPIVVDAVVDVRYRDPEVFVTSQDGDTSHLQVEPGRPGGFIARLSCARPGRHQIEIMASDATGPTVLANFPVWCAAVPPMAITVEPARDEPPIETSEDGEQRLLASINRDRAAAGVPALRWSGAVAAVARGHSEDMRRTHVVAHILPATGSALDRTRAAHLTPRIVLENVVRAYGLDEAHRALMDSPGHRANVLSPEVTDIGIGVVLGDDTAGRRELFITEVFTRGAPAYRVISPL